MSKFNSWADVAKLWPRPGCKALSDDIGVPAKTLEKQVERNSVRPGLWRPMIDSARRRGIRGVHANSLTDLAYKIRSEKK